MFQLISAYFAVALCFLLTCLVIDVAERLAEKCARKSPKNPQK